VVIIEQVRQEDARPLASARHARRRSLVLWSRIHGEPLSLIARFRCYSQE